GDHEVEAEQIDENERERERERLERAREKRPQRVLEHAAERPVGAADGERPEHELDDEQGEEQVDGEHGQDEHASAAVERDRVPAEPRSAREDRAEEEAAPPMSAQ